MINKHKNFFNIKGLLLVSGFSILTLASCTAGFDNLNHHEANEEMMGVDNLKTGSFFTQMLRNVVPFKDGTHDDGTYQIAQGLTSDLYSGYLTTTIDRDNGVHNGSYSFVQGWIGQTFKCGFTDVMPAWQSIVEIARELNQPEVEALATIVKVEAMHRVADSYGPIPYINFGSGSLVNLYDGLDDVYKRFFEELDTSIDNLSDFYNGNPGSALMADYDLVYGGDVKKWLKFANTLRLRLALRVVYAEPGLAQAEAVKSLSHPLGVIEEVADRAELKHSSKLIYHHPLHEIAYNFNGGEVRMSASMDAYLNGYKDPRRGAYFKPASDGNYHGVRLGISGSTTNYKGAQISNLNVDDSTTPIVWMNAAESYFLRAECAIRNWNGMGLNDAKELYNKGIRVSFEENNLQGADNYLNDESSKPIAFTDVFGKNSTTQAPSSITIKWKDAGQEEMLERIITQKWIACYPNGPEGWAEFRRTGYPRLITVANNNSNGTVDTNIQICRISFPQSEYNTNETGVNSGIAKLGGQDTGGTKLWWDKKD